jgi:acid phosphatase type 7
MRGRVRRSTLAAVGGLLAVALAFAVLLGLGQGGLLGGGPTSPPGSTVTVVAVGDIGVCDSNRDSATATLAAQTTGTILALGDIAYPDGTAANFSQCFEQSWGRLKDRIRPTPGNHEYNTPDAAPYFAYFGSAAGRPGEGWYSFDVGAWHVVSLNSNCNQIEGGCKAGSPQEQWLRQDLADNPAQCTLAFWHAPRFSSGREHGGTKDVADLWSALTDAGAEVVLTGHEHLYERFAPMDADGEKDEARGLREFVVGTGGAESYRFGRSRGGSEARIDDTPGVLKLTLGATSYSWDFVPVTADGKGDSGTDRCH